MLVLVSLSLLLAAVTAAPSGDYVQTPVVVEEKQTVIPGGSSTQYHAQSSDGGFVYGYQDPNSQKHEEGNGDYGVVKGSYSYIAPDGTPVVNEYYADDYGFRSSLAPTAPFDVYPEPDYSQPRYAAAYSSAGYAPQALYVPQQALPATVAVETSHHTVQSPAVEHHYAEAAPVVAYSPAASQTIIPVDVAPAVVHQAVDYAQPAHVAVTHHGTAHSVAAPAVTHAVHHEVHSAPAVAHAVHPAPAVAHAIHPAPAVAHAVHPAPAVAHTAHHAVHHAPAVAHAAHHNIHPAPAVTHTSHHQVHHAPAVAHATHHGVHHTSAVAHATHHGVHHAPAVAHAAHHSPAVAHTAHHGVHHAPAVSHASHHQSHSALHGAHSTHHATHSAHHVSPAVSHSVHHGAYAAPIAHSDYAPSVSHYGPPSSYDQPPHFVDNGLYVDHVPAASHDSPQHPTNQITNDDDPNKYDDAIRAANVHKATEGRSSSTYGSPLKSSVTSYSINHVGNPFVRYSSRRRYGSGYH